MALPRSLATDPRALAHSLAAPMLPGPPSPAASGARNAVLTTATASTAAPLFAAFFVSAFDGAVASVVVVLALAHTIGLAGSESVAGSAGAARASSRDAARDEVAEHGPLAARASIRSRAHTFRLSIHTNRCLARVRLRRWRCLACSLAAADGALVVTWACVLARIPEKSGLACTFTGTIARATRTADKAAVITRARDGAVGTEISTGTFACAAHLVARASTGTDRTSTEWALLIATRASPANRARADTAG